MEDKQYKKELLEFLGSYVTDHKHGLMDKVLDERTRHITVALENIFQPHNASAVVRSCDCFGITDLYTIENTNTYTQNPQVSMGAGKWVQINQFNDEGENTLKSIKALKEKGYRIVATTPHKNDYTPDTLPLDKPIALFFGTELEGLTDTVIDNADDYLMIPMHGFTESFNISVSAALCLYRLVSRLKESDVNWQLSEDEKIDLKLEWVKKIVKRSPTFEKEFQQRYKK